MQDIEAAIGSALRDGRLPCSIAHDLAKENGWTPAQVGAEANRLEVKISLCQLGLFGFKSFKRKKLVQRFDLVPEDLAASIGAAERDGRIACAKLWRLAQEHGLPRVAAGCAAETLNFAVIPCQLGCF